MTPYLDTWCQTCRTWHSSVWVHIGNRVVKVNDVPAPLLETRRPPEGGHERQRGRGAYVGRTATDVREPYLTAGLPTIAGGG